MPSKTYTNGLHKDISNKEYHSADGLSSTQFKLMEFSQEAYKNRDLFRYESKAFSFGQLVHSMVLEPETVDGLYIESPTKGLDTKAAKELGAENPDKTVIGQGMLQEAKEIAEKVRAIFGAELSNENSIKEASVFYNSEDTGLLFKARPDVLFQRPDGSYIIFDVKTTKETTKRGFMGTIEKYNYDLQAAWYKDTCKLAGLNVVAFGWIVIPSTVPNVPFGLLCSNELELQGRAKYNELVNEYMEYKQTGVDPRKYAEAHSWNYISGKVDEEGNPIETY